MAELNVIEIHVSRLPSEAHCAQLEAFMRGTALKNAPAVPWVCVSPVCWRPRGGGRYWYFVLASADRQEEFHIDLVDCGGDPEDAADCRAYAIWWLTQQKPTVVLDCDVSEVMFAETFVSLWPSARTRRLLADVKAGN